MRLQSLDRKRFLSFGKFRGCEIRTVERSYLRWLQRTLSPFSAENQRLLADIEAALTDEEYPPSEDEQWERLYADYRPYDQS
jgi:hypothetical protein